MKFAPALLLVISLPCGAALAEDRDPFRGVALVAEHAIDLDGDGWRERVVAVRAADPAGDSTGRRGTKPPDSWPPDSALLGAGGLLVHAGPGTDSAWSGFRNEEYAPFVLRFGDIDGDGETEIAAGVIDRGLAAPGAPRGRIRQQIHFFRWRNGRLVPLWFCGRRYEDFRLAPLGGRIRLIELSRARSVFQLQIYHWQGFGWWRDAAIALGAEDVTMSEDGAVVILERADGRRVEVGWDDRESAPRFRLRS